MQGVLAIRSARWAWAAVLLLLPLAACGGTPQDAAPKKNPIDCVFNGPCTGK